MTATAARLITADELMALPDDGKRYELVRGELICMSPAAYRSGTTAGRLFRKLADFADEHDLGECGIPDTGFRLASNPDTVRGPDVWFLRADRLPSPEAQDRYYQGAPDLAVEIVSPSDRFREVMDKVRDYLRAGTGLVWVLDPATRTTLVFRADGSYAWVEGDGALSGEDVLPGFALPLRDVFK